MTKELIFGANKTKIFLMLLACIGFVALGFGIKESKPLIGWLCIVFFGLGIPLSITMMLPNGMSLRLDEEGFESRTLIRTTKTKWSDVESFRIDSIRGAKMIAVVYKPHYSNLKMLRQANQALAGFEGAIPNSYRVSLQELERVLNEWLGRYGS